MTMFCRPGLVAAMPGQAPPTASMSQAPKPMCAPEIMPRAKILLGAMPAFFWPAATAPSYPGRGSARDPAGAAAWATGMLARTARTGDAAKRDGCEAMSPCSELVQMARMVSLRCTRIGTMSVADPREELGSEGRVNALCLCECSCAEVP